MNRVFDRTWFRGLSWLLVGACLAAIFYGSSLSHASWPEWAANKERVLRFFEYNFLAFLLANAVSRGGHKRRFWAAFALAASFAAADEAHRYLATDNAASLAGWFVDAVGAWAGAYLYLKSERLWRKEGRR